jgi:HSP20 family protein
MLEPDAGAFASSPPYEDQHMSLIRWEPFRDTDEFMNRMMPSLLRRWPAGMLPDNGKSALDWTPTADISESEHEYLIRAELPAVKKEDVKVTVHDGVIAIEGERRYDKEEKTEKFHRRESFQGKFSRSFMLPDDADESGIRAESKDGVLVVRVPKAKVEKSKSQQVKVE